MENTIKFGIKSALERKGFKTTVSNIEKVYQMYMSPGCSSYNVAIDELKDILQKNGK